ncbi:Spy/CpxP family protein refolding chaperone [Salinimonas chungwhensis]|uniref:Spy/CpxP family protein refolding chaperone n=1 Tax=Salinimonas chungwhensis TaxID=265425 RepID=UPI00035C861C|nr:Spy/CpxP family protein refolding chaperone [Salinimonas chungwhensis]
MKQPLLIATISAVLFTTSGLASAKNHHGQQRSGIPRVYHSLNLTTTQQAQIREIVTSLRPQNRQQAKRNHADLIEFENENAFLAAFSERIQKHKEKALARAKARHEIYQLLSTTQKQALKEKGARKPARKHHPEGRTDGLPAHFGALDLSAAQKLAITAIVNAGVEIKRDTKQLFLRLRDQEREMIYAENFDEAAWLDWFDTYAGEKRTAALSRFHRKNGLIAQLTPAQSEMLAKMHHAPKRGHHRSRYY